MKVGLQKLNNFVFDENFGGLIIFGNIHFYYRNDGLKKIINLLKFCLKFTWVVVIINFISYNLVNLADKLVKKILVTSEFI